MQRLTRTALLAVILSVAVAAGAVFAAAPPTNPNGFPSGEHYNLNLIGKKPGFDGCAVPMDPGTLQPLYGNVVFVPENGAGDIWLQSGSGRKTTGVSTLQVTDPCVTAFDTNPATVQLPALPDGYWVYARALGKLTDDPSMKIAPDLITVSSTDDTLVYLGYVTATGFVNAAGTTVYRAKGKHPAVPISDLFAWQGDVCYESDLSATLGVAYTPKDVCLLDTNGDGWLDIVGYPVAGVCAEGTLASLYCHTYDTAWLFNIADFVNYLWSVDNAGTKLVQIRFYPR